MGDSGARNKNHTLSPLLFQHLPEGKESRLTNTEGEDGDRTIQQTRCQLLAQSNLAPIDAAVEETIDKQTECGVSQDLESNE